MSNGEVYDIAIIGSGPAGEKAAMQAAKLRKRTLLVERDRHVGGSCLHRGTIPSKSLRETVVHLELLRRRTHGIDTSLPDDVTISELMYRTSVVVAERAEALRRNLEKNRVKLVRGQARLLGPTELEITPPGGGPPTRVTARHTVIAAGSRPRRPDWAEFDDERIFDSDTILELPRLPRKLTVIGAGVVGCEYACMFSHLGIRVNLIAKDRAVLPFLDREIAEALVYGMRQHRITMRLGEEVSSIRRTAPDRVEVCLESGKCLPCSTVLVAAGRQSNSDGLGLEDVGVEMATRGRPKVNEVFQTSVGNVYAVGDVIGFPGLASTAMNQARTAVLHAFGALDDVAMPTDLPLGIWTIPPAAMVGQTEEQLTDAQIPYDVGLARFGEVARANILGQWEEGFLKLLFSPDDGKLLGVHILGPRAPELIHLGQSVLFFGGTIDYFANAVFNYPTLDEAYRIAAFNGLNRRKHDM